MADVAARGDVEVRWIMEAGGFRPPPGSDVWGSLMLASGKAGHAAAVREVWADATAGLAAPPAKLLHAYMHACNTCSQVRPLSLSRFCQTGQVTCP